jgi:exonuclease SbcC
MIIKRIKLNNIRSYEREEINFPKGSTLLSGEIGSGKTSILLAIEYALFGLQPGQRGSALLSNNKDSGGVELELDINEKNIILERRLKRGSKTINQDYCSITIDGKKEELSISETKSKVLKILNYPNEFLKKTNLLYKYTVYTPQEEMKQIILENSEQRLNVLRHTFGIDKYKRIRENLSLINFKIRGKIREIKIETNNLDEEKNKILSLQTFTDDLEKKILEKELLLKEKIKERERKEVEENNLTGKIKEKENFDKESEKTKILLGTKISSLSEIEKEILEIERRISGNKQLYEEEDYLRNLDKLKKKKDFLKELDKLILENSTKINSLLIKEEEIMNKKERIFKIDLCPTCLQDVSEAYKNNILNKAESELIEVKKELNKLNLRLEEIKDNSNSEKLSIDKLEEKKSELELLKHKTKELEIIKERSIELGKSKKELNKDIEFLKNHFSLLKKSSLEFSKYENLYRQKKIELKELLTKEKRIEIESAEVKKELELTKKEIEYKKKRIKEGEIKMKKLNKLQRLEDWLTNDFLNLVSFTEKNIMAKVRNEFSELFNKWFSMLTPDNFHVRLDENFTPVITQKDFELDYGFLSGGERTAVALAYRLALNQIINSLFSNINTQGLIILDEPTDGFSEQQLDKIRDILQEINSNQLILVSHEQKIEGFVDNVIKLKKEQGLSSQDYQKT